VNSLPSRDLALRANGDAIPAPDLTNGPTFWADVLDAYSVEVARRVKTDS
jgi:hypothetical protein